MSGRRSGAAAAAGWLRVVGRRSPPPCTDDRRLTTNDHSGGSVCRLAFRSRRGYRLEIGAEKLVDGSAELLAVLCPGDVLAEGSRARDAGEVADGELAHDHRAPV